ncbi:MAG: HEPN domain-containing protein [Bacteroidia bacterium]
MIEDILLRFDKNIERVDNLIDLYSEINQGRGRKTGKNLDLLRATTVLMHSTLEDYLRSLLLWKLPLASKEKMAEIPLTGTSNSGRKTKFELQDLVVLRGNTVDQVISKSIEEYLGTISFNNTSDISANLGKISVELTEEIRDCFPGLTEMIKRRHNIVHQADRSDKPGSGNHSFQSIGLKQVKDWKDTLDRFVSEVNKDFYSYI